MKLIRIALPVLLLLLATTARAQLEVSLTMPNTTLLRCESVPAIVTIRNNTGMEIPIGGATGYDLSFEVKNADSQPLRSDDQSPVIATTLAPGATTVITNDLFRCFRLMEIQQASVIARVDYGGRSYISQRIFLDIQNGTEIARIQVPAGNKSIAHILRTLNRGGHAHLFLRVDDETGGWTYGAFDLGTALLMTPPQIMTDRAGLTHILHRSGPQEFNYRVADANGTFLKFEQFTGDYKNVHMTVNESGEIAVNGKPTEKGERPSVLQASPLRADLHRKF